MRLLPATRDLIVSRVRFEWLDPIVRMEVNAVRAIVPTEAGLVEPLGTDDASALAELYADWPESRFHQARLRQGYQYVGVREGSRIIAAAEHVLMAADGESAIVQGVLVSPGARGRGLAKAVTAALTLRLFASGCEQVVPTSGPATCRRSRRTHKSGTVATSRCWPGPARDDR